MISCNSDNPPVDSREFVLFSKTSENYHRIYMNNELFVEAYENCNLYKYQLNQKKNSIH